MEPQQPTSDEPDVRAMYPHMAKVFGEAGWDDPQMDVYDDLDPRRHISRPISSDP